MAIATGPKSLEELVFLTSKGCVYSLAAGTMRSVTAREDAESYKESPQFEPDGWADLEKVDETSRRALLKRLDDEEREAGHETW